jgi:hypothetical protein
VALSFLVSEVLAVEPAVVANTVVPSLDVVTGDGDPVLLDGVFTEGEWDDAAVMVVNDAITLRAKQYRGHLFLGIDCPTLVAPVVDLYLAFDNSQILQLHVSAQLGEKILYPGKSNLNDDRFEWGHTTDWYANEFRWNSPLTDSLVRHAGKSWDEAVKTAMFGSEGVEFQIRKSKIPFDHLRLRVQIGTAGHYDQPVVFPAATTVEKVDDWLALIVGESPSGTAPEVGR